jgi:hypothetical protein
MKTMIMNNKFKIGGIIEGRNCSVVAHNGMFFSFKYGYNGSFLPYSTDILLTRLELNACLRIGLKVTEQHFMINSTVASSPTDLEGFVLLMSRIA